MLGCLSPSLRLQLALAARCDAAHCWVRVQTPFVIFHCFPLHWGVQWCCWHCSCSIYWRQSVVQEEQGGFGVPAVCGLSLFAGRTWGRSGIGRQECGQVVPSPFYLKVRWSLKVGFYRCKSSSAVSQKGMIQPAFQRAMVDLFWRWLHMEFSLSSLVGFMGSFFIIGGFFSCAVETMAWKDKSCGWCGTERLLHLPSSLGATPSALFFCVIAFRIH